MIEEPNERWHKTTSADSWNTNKRKNKMEVETNIWNLLDV